MAIPLEPIRKAPDRILVSVSDAGLDAKVGGFKLIAATVCVPEDVRAAAPLRLTDPLAQRPLRKDRYS